VSRDLGVVDALEAVVDSVIQREPELRALDMHGDLLCTPMAGFVEVPTNCRELGE
jgi:hypothetical protein